MPIVRRKRGKPSLKKLSIKLIPQTKADYEKARNKHIAGYTEYETGGFFGFGHDVSRPDVATAKWNQWYPNGYDDWVSTHGEHLSPHGEQMLIDKINEIVDVLHGKTGAGST